MSIKIEGDKERGRSIGLHGRDATVRDFALATNIDAHLASGGKMAFSFTASSMHVMRGALQMFVDDCLEKLAEPDADELALENIRLRAQLKDRINEIDALNNAQPTNATTTERKKK